MLRRSTSGNRVREQFQLDAFGEALLLFAAADRLDALDADGWKAAEVAVDAIGQRYGEPDAGIWELEPRRWTHSRLMCAAGLRAVAARRPEQAADWSRLADRIVADTSRDGLHPDGRWQRSPDDAARRRRAPPARPARRRAGRRPAHAWRPGGR